MAGVDPVVVEGDVVGADGLGGFAALGVRGGVVLGSAPGREGRVAADDGSRGGVDGAGNNSGVAGRTVATCGASDAATENAGDVSANDAQPDSATAASTAAATNDVIRRLRRPPDRATPEDSPIGTTVRGRAATGASISGWCAAELTAVPQWAGAEDYG